MKGKYFIRKHASNHLMSLEEIANEHLKTINLSWDFALDPNHGVKDISLEKVNRFVDMANTLRDRPISDDPLTVLRKFELTREQGITFGCFLLFCNEPTLSTTIDVGCFDSETIIRDGATIRNDLFSEVEACLDFVQKHLSKHFIIRGKAQRDEVWEYPLEAVREIVLNMIVHRDYRASADSTIKIFQDRIEFFNPGTLLEGVSLEDILSGKNASNSRNKQIATIFKEDGIIEKYGSGIKRVRQAMHAAGAKTPVFEIVGNFFKVTLYPLGGGVNDGVSGGVNAVLDYLSKHPGTKAHEIATSLGISERTFQRLLKKLREEGKVEFRGAPKTGGYFILKNDK